jgi:hypothetical protein
MPAKSEKQRKAACARLGEMKSGKRPAKDAPFRGATKQALREYCRKTHKS